MVDLQYLNTRGERGNVCRLGGCVRRELESPQIATMAPHEIQHIQQCIRLFMFLLKDTRDNQI